MSRSVFRSGANGTATIVAAWFDALRERDATLRVLSFDHLTEAWSATDLARLRADGARIDVLPAYAGVGRASGRARRTLGFAWRLVAASRFVPERIRLDRATRRALDAVLAEPFDAIVLHGTDSVHLVGRHRLRRNGARIVLDLHDLLPLRIRLLQRALLRLARDDGLAALRHVRASEWLAAAVWRSAEALPAAERRQLLACDLVLCASDEERGALRRAGIDGALLRPLRWPIAPPPAGFGPEQVDHAFGFIGSDAVFNQEALRHFCRAIWPLIRAGAPDARLLVAGDVAGACASLPADARRGVDAIGRIPDVGAFYARVRVVVVPLLSGTGVSVKTMEAAAFGRAIVSTAAGLRGLALRDGIEVCLARDPRSFAEASLRLLRDDALRDRLGAAARRAMLTVHDPESFAASLPRLLAAAA